MPELPEVEVVRRGLARWVTGSAITSVEVLHPRPIRRHLAGADDFAARLADTRVLDVVRRGKFLWLVLDSGEALLAHLGMSGQLVLQPPAAADEKHLRVRLRLASAAGSELSAEVSAELSRVLGRELRFIDQRMFGGVSLEELVPTPDGGPGGWGGVLDPGVTESAQPESAQPKSAQPESAQPESAQPESAQPDSAQPEGGLAVVTTAVAPLVPAPVAHIARDALDPDLDVEELRVKLRRRKTGLKRALLDQTLVSGIGNIYADEALWIARLHYARATENVTRAELSRLMDAVQQVMREALAQGGTSFDSLYVNVNGSSGYFERSLKAYGRAGRPCQRCGTLIRRESFMNRSSFFCPQCQRTPRTARF